ncbi:orotate phosphoribosyltransferase [Dyadobacter fermentans]|uniref:Orotate phosphoribosyltransferase n=1 Tax=Dyadobacter fermentans (strain ATCC 700827 / DSM 18053 / CIP 107007 / KCTC 52180 / NS114) TaxID=471854 RepID=C6VX37_DYAFD|nr:orotate phosphoribosyltransferase [Dyadobacter fermentans]ACT91510.1 orotate phosphoribosyltransferase [Dyadobacter fermentans DSM 18053]
MSNDLDITKRIAELLLEAQAIKLSPEKPFQWSSGWFSPIYCDNRVALSYPDTRTFIKKALAGVIREKYPHAQAVVGVATGGIAQGALVADLLELPFAYVRPEPKKHGMGNQIEGRLEKGQSVVIIEDLISTGGSSLKTVDALREAGIEVGGMVAIFTYGFQVAADNFTAKNVELHTISNYNALIEVALEHKYVSEAQLESLAAWRVAPEGWGR